MKTKEIKVWLKTVKLAMTGLGWSWAKLARKAEMSEATLTRWKDGSRHPSPRCMAMIVETLKKGYV